MVPVFRSLEQISTGHTVFERDQVLTHDQLNSLAGYADDQTRLTRVRLLGVGIVCGLRPSLSGSAVRVTRGIGVTTDGDLLHLDQDAVFDRFRPYDESFPAYPPLYAGAEVEGEMIDAFELVPEGMPAEGARPLEQFGAVGMKLADMTAVLLMESYIRDDDLCSGTDCDNQGREAVNTPKLLLVRRADAGTLREALRTPAAAWDELEEVVADRPRLAPSTDTPAEFAAAYRTACANTHENLVAALSRLLERVPEVLEDAVPEAGAWLGRLNSLWGEFAERDAGIQYYYDFLKDVVATYNELRERLFDDATICAPPVETFPKHLLLGDLAPGPDRDADRTGFYPSPLTSHSAGELEHARFLARKLGALLGGFRESFAAEGPVRVTPSAFEDRPLEERAIPFYYAPGGDDPIHRHWSYRLSRRRKERFNYSYHADSYEARGGAANPFGSQIGRFPFFRVEGHVGQRVDEAAEAIEKEIRTWNLPFTVRAVLLGREREKLASKPAKRFTDLHHFHHLLRHDLVRQLDEVRNFSGEFKARVQQASGKLPEEDVESYEYLASKRDSDIQEDAQGVSAALRKSYIDYRAASPASPSWASQMKCLLKSTGEFKAELSPAVKTDFTTPFDTLIGNREFEWLPWIDNILDEREKKNEERLLFERFVKEHPGVEHFAGVTRGGTFVLLYDDDGVVVGDVMLAYHVPEEVSEPVEPELAETTIRPDNIVKNGVKVITPTTKYLHDKLVDFETTVMHPKIQEKFTEQTDKFNVFRDSYLGTFQNSLELIRHPSFQFEPGEYQPIDPAYGAQFQDEVLGTMVEESRVKRRTLERLRQRYENPEVPDKERQLVQDYIKEAEADLARKSEQITNYVSEGGVSVTEGSEGYRATVEISQNLGQIQDQTVLNAAKESLGGIVNATQNQGMKGVFSGILNI